MTNEESIITLTNGVIIRCKEKMTAYDYHFNKKWNEFKEQNKSLRVCKQYGTLDKSYKDTKFSEMNSYQLGELRRYIDREVSNLLEDEPSLIWIKGIAYEPNSPNKIIPNGEEIHEMFIRKNQIVTTHF